MESVEYLFITFSYSLVDSDLEVVESVRVPSIRQVYLHKNDLCSVGLWTKEKNILGNNSSKNIS